MVNVKFSLHVAKSRSPFKPSLAYNATQSLKFPALHKRILYSSPKNSQDYIYKLIGWSTQTINYIYIPPWQESKNSTPHSSSRSTELNEDEAERRTLLANNGAERKKRKGRNPPGMYLATFPISTSSSVASCEERARSRPGEQCTGVPAGSIRYLATPPVYTRWWDGISTQRSPGTPVRLCYYCVGRAPENIQLSLSARRLYLTVFALDRSFL
jgi:hypothetical protein